MNRQEALNALNQLKVSEDMTPDDEALLFALCATLMRLNPEEFSAALDGVRGVRIINKLNEVCA